MGGGMSSGLIYRTHATPFTYQFLALCPGESTWDHPCDVYYRKLYEEEKRKKMTKDKAKHDQSKQQDKAKHDKSQQQVSLNDKFVVR